MSKLSLLAIRVIAHVDAHRNIYVPTALGIGAVVVVDSIRKNSDDEAAA